MYPKQVIPMLMQIYSGIPSGVPGQPPTQLPQPVKETMLRTVVGMSKLMEKMLEFFGEDETGDFVPPYKLEEFAFEMMDMAQGQMLRRLTSGKEGPTAGGAGGGQVLPGGDGQSPGWRVLNRMIREIQVQETQVLKTGKDSQPLFQAQGVLLGFEKLSEMVTELLEANEDALKLLLPKEE